MGARTGAGGEGPQWGERTAGDRAGTAERHVGEIPDALPSAVLDHGEVVPDGERQLVLHARDRRDRSGVLKLGDRHVRQPDRGDLAFVSQTRERADALGQRHVRVDMVQLIEVDALDAEGPQADLAVAPERRGPAVDGEIDAVAPMAALRCDDGLLAAPLAQRSGYDGFGEGFDAGAGVRECRVDQSHARLQRGQGHLDAVIRGTAGEGQRCCSQPDAAELLLLAAHRRRSFPGRCFVSSLPRIGGGLVNGSEDGSHPGRSRACQAANSVRVGPPGAPGRSEH